LIKQFVQLVQLFLTEKNKMKKGDLIMFIKTGEYAVYLGFFEDVYIFQHKDYVMRVPKRSFTEQSVEVVRESR